ncbi:hypothetical protein ACWCSD_31455, partial [Nonomuraea sp. NPDC001684]
MRAWVVDRPGPMATGPLVRVERDVPEPGPGEVLVRVEACGVCRTWGAVVGMRGERSRRNRPSP